jgi:hypothetical protein
MANTRLAWAPLLQPSSGDFTQAVPACARLKSVRLRIKASLPGNVGLLRFYTAPAVALLVEVEENQTDTSWSESDELRSGRDAARAALNDVATEVRAALAKVQTVAAAVRQLCEADEDNLIL